MAGKTDGETGDAILRQALGGTGDCPSIETLSSDMQQTVEQPARLAAELHLRQCFHCRTELHLLREFESGTIRPDEKAAVQWISSRLAVKGTKPLNNAGWGLFAGRSRKPGSLSWWNPQVMTGLGAAALVAVLAVALFIPRGVKDSRERNVPEFGNEVQRSQAIEIADIPGVFQWKPVSGAVQYELTVRGIDNAVVFHNTFTTLTLAFPPEVVRTVSTGKLLLWEVVALDVNGNAVARSGIRQLRQSPR